VNTLAARSGNVFAVRRRAPRGPGRWLLRGSLGLTVLIVLGAVAAWLGTGATFAVRRVETGVYRFTDGKVLEDRLAALLGRNIWRLDGDEIATLLADLPWVRDVAVTRRLPAELHLDLAEWRPLLDVAGTDGGATPQVLVGDGRVLPFPTDLVPPALPVLTGVTTLTDADGGRRLEPAVGAQVLELLAALQTTGLEAACPVDFVVARSGGFAIVLQGGAATLLLGREDFRERLERYLVAREHLAAGLEVDLRFRDRVTVRRPSS
jgi:cell division septal protein FtsQ